MSKSMKAKEAKKVIKEFIHHVETLEKEEDLEGNGFNREYRSIQDEQLKNRRENVFPMEAGKSDNNLRKNRYKDILPYDDHRVTLTPLDGEEDSDYINASMLMGVKGTGGYIASQGPLAVTVNDFWRMIWEKDVEIIFMACRIVELGKIKCKQYWNDVDKADDFGDITVFTEAEEELAFDFIRRKFRVKRGDEERHVTQFHYSGWPDHGIPEDPDHIRDLIEIMRHARQKDESPLLVHCSAGCGRTGAIIAIDFVWTLLEEGRFDESFSLYDLICQFRKQRMSIVQTPDQYALVYKVLKSLCLEWLKRMASHTYVNVELEEGQEYCNVGEVNGTDKTPDAKDSTGPAGDRITTEDGPVIVDLPHPVDAAPYENVLGSPEKPSSKVPAPQPGADNAGKPVHTTVIRISTHNSTNNQTASASQGGQSSQVKPNRGRKDVTYVVQQGANKTTSMHPPKPSTASKHSSKGPAPASPRSISDGAVYSEVKKGHEAVSPVTSPTSPVIPARTATAVSSEISAGPTVSLQSAPPKPQAKTTTPCGDVYSEVLRGPKTSHQPAPPKSPAKITATDGVAYAIVNKDQTSNFPTSSQQLSHTQKKDGAQSGGKACVSPSAMHNKDSHYSLATTDSVYSIATPYNDYETVFPSQSQASSYTGRGKQSRAHHHHHGPTNQDRPYKGFVLINGKSVADHPPGFKRLPRVKGPVKMPQSWSKP